MHLSRFAPILFATALAGCGSFGAVGLGPMDQPQPVQSDTLPPVASAKVEKSALPPPPVDPNAAVAALPTDPNALPPGTTPPADTTQPAPAATPAPTTTARAELGRTDLLGGWTLKSGGDSCQLFMTLTSWTGGYRASTRGCQTATLKSISAWSLSGSQVVLSGANGSPVARLNSAGTNRFDGSTDSPAQAVSFYR